MSKREKLILSAKVKLAGLGDPYPVIDVIEYFGRDVPVR